MNLKRVLTTSRSNYPGSFQVLIRFSSMLGNQSGGTLKAFQNASQHLDNRHTVGLTVWTKLDEKIKSVRVSIDQADRLEGTPSPGSCTAQPSPKRAFLGP